MSGPDKGAITPGSRRNPEAGSDRQASGWEWAPASGEITFEAFRASGPGGQNVNKVSSAVRLRLDVAGSATIPQSVKQRLTTLAGRRMTAEGILRIEARRARTQEANRDAALERLRRLMAAAAQPVEERVPTRVPRPQRHARQRIKRRRAEVKRRRKVAPAEME
jgi:ribosome-associated protein